MRIFSHEQLDNDNSHGNLEPYGLASCPLWLPFSPPFRTSIETFAHGHVGSLVSKNRSMLLVSNLQIKENLI